MKRWIAGLVIMVLLCGLAGCKASGNEEAFIDTFVANNETAAKEKPEETPAVTPPADTDEEQPEDTPTVTPPADADQPEDTPSEEPGDTPAEDPEEEALVNSPKVNAKWKASGLTEQYRKPFFELFIEHPLKEISGFPFAEMVQYNQKSTADKSLVALRCIFYTYDDFVGLTTEEVMAHKAYAERKKNLLLGCPSGYSDYTVVDLAYESNGDLIPKNIRFCKNYSSADLLSGAVVLPEWGAFADQWKIFEGEKVPFEKTTCTLLSGISVIDVESVTQDDQITVLQLKSMEDVQRVKEGSDMGRYFRNKEFSDEYFNEKRLYLVYQHNAQSSRLFSDLRKNENVLEIWATDMQEYGEFWTDDGVRYGAYLIEVPIAELDGIDQVKIRTSQEVYTITLAESAW